MIIWRINQLNQIPFSMEYLVKMGGSSFSRDGKSSSVCTNLSTFPQAEQVLQHLKQLAVGLTVSRISAAEWISRICNLMNSSIIYGTVMKLDFAQHRHAHAFWQRGCTCTRHHWWKWKRILHSWISWWISTSTLFHLQRKESWELMDARWSGRKFFLVSDCGWIEAANFKQWFQRMFVPAVKYPTASSPAVLIFDGHHSHISIKLTNTQETLGAVSSTGTPAEWISEDWIASSIQRCYSS